MGVPLDKFMDRFSAEERRTIDARAEALIAEEMSLRDLRKAMGKTQAAVAEKLCLKQENVSRVEQRADMLLSTLDGYLRAMGGRLRLVVEFKDRAPVRLSGLGLINPLVKHRAVKIAPAKLVVPKRAKSTAAKPAASKSAQAHAVRAKQRKAATRRATTPAGGTGSRRLALKRRRDRPTIE
jgi:hypothetical protein